MPAMTSRPVIMGRRGVVTSGHYLATAAGLRILARGGNAIDAAAATSFCLNLVEPHQNGLAGEVPTLIYSAHDRQTYALSGVGWTPAAFTIDWCRANDIDLIPSDGYLPATVPAPVDTWATALARFGTLSFAEVLQPAIELAEGGWPLDDQLHAHLTKNARKYVERYPSTAEIFCPNGRVPEIGDVMRNPDWARTLRRLAEAEAAAQGRGRVAGIEAARDVFYRGEIAERIVEFITHNPVVDASGRDHTGLLSLDDLAAWHATVETPASVAYRGLDVHKCPTWTQGPVLLQQLAILAGYDLQSLGHNSPDYLHLLIETAKLAFADRETYYGDPRFDDVPLDILLSESYNSERRRLIEPRASLDFRPGDVGRGIPAYATFDVAADNRRALGRADAPPLDLSLAAGRSHTGDTTHLDVVDRAGNMVSATPSGGWLEASPVIRGLGFPLGTRGQMFFLNPARPNALAPHKRPRATLTPSVATRDGAPYLVFGTPGDDAQDQWALQFFLNYVDFGMNIQAALEAPTVHSAHFPSSFFPRTAYPGRMHAEGRIDPATLAELERRGHEVIVDGDWDHGKPLAIRYDGERDIILGGASPRRGLGYALGW